MGMVLDLSRNTGITNNTEYEGGFIVTPRSGCYEGVAMSVLALFSSPTTTTKATLEIMAWP
jgi:hypothetical protein